MIDSLPLSGCDQWLARLEPETAKCAPLPLDDILAGSLYYPASGFDGDPVAYLAGNFHSFVYVDYGYSRDDLAAELDVHGFLGYRILFQREVAWDELVPQGWHMDSLPTAADGDPSRARISPSIPFCTWTVLQRLPDHPPGHGPHRFSLLYLCADGVAAYQALYTGNRRAPAAIAIIQPGTGFGGNWTDFTNPHAILARSVRENPAGQPEYLLYGGNGGRDFYRTACWPGYAQPIGWLGNTSISVWRRT